MDPEVNIAGVILNKVKNKAHYMKTKKSIENLAKVEVIGAIKREDKIKVEERHLGLVPAKERENSLKYIDIWAKTIEESIECQKENIIIMNF